MEDLGTSWTGVVILEVVAATLVVAEVATAEAEVVMVMILTMVQEEVMVEVRVMEEAEEGVMEVAAPGMATRGVDLVAVAMVDTEAMEEVTEGAEIIMTSEIMVDSSRAMGP